MSTPHLVEQFYSRIWNAGEHDAAADIVSDDFAFRGSLGSESKGRVAFKRYVRSVRGALAEYRCDILECVAAGDRAFAKMRFAGRHTAEFRGYAPTGRLVEWLGAALFRFEENRITELWVLGDLAGLDAKLEVGRLTVG